MSDRFTGQLSEYLDGDLELVERLELEAHLATCDACAETLASLRAVVARARHLEEREPTGVRWRDVEARIRGTAPGASPAAEPAESRRHVTPLPLWRARLSFTWPQAAAAAAALVLLSGGTVWWALDRGVPTLASQGAGGGGSVSGAPASG